MTGPLAELPCVSAGVGAAEAVSRDVAEEQASSRLRSPREAGASSSGAAASSANRGALLFTPTLHTPVCSERSSLHRVRITRPCMSSLSSGSAERQPEPDCSDLSRSPTQAGQCWNCGKAAVSADAEQTVARTTHPSHARASLRFRFALRKRASSDRAVGRSRLVLCGRLSDRDTASRLRGDCSCARRGSRPGVGDVASSPGPRTTGMGGPRFIRPLVLVPRSALPSPTARLGPSADVRTSGCPARSCRRGTR